MLVEEVMNTNVVTLPPTASIADALQLLQKQRVRHLPIIDSNKSVIGIVSDRNVRDTISAFMETDSNHKVKEEIQTIMSKPVVTVHPLDFVEDIARIFYDFEYASLPVVSDDKLVGIVTERDMLYTLIQLTGTNVQASHIEVKVPDRPGALPEITSIFGNRNINIASILIYPYKDKTNYKIVVFRFQTMNPTPIIEEIRDAGFELMWPNNIQEQES